MSFGRDFATSRHSWSTSSNQYAYRSTARRTQRRFSASERIVRSTSTFKCVEMHRRSSIPRKRILTTTSPVSASINRPSLLCPTPRSTHSISFRLHSSNTHSRSSTPSSSRPSSAFIYRETSHDRSEFSSPIHNAHSAGTRASSGTCIDGMTPAVSTRKAPPATGICVLAIIRPRSP